MTLAEILTKDKEAERMLLHAISWHFGGKNPASYREAFLHSAIGEFKDYVFEKHGLDFQEYT